MNTQNYRPAQRICRAFFLMLCGLAAPLAQAQNFEAYYGENPSRDAGADVKSVNVCLGGGSIVAGTRRTAVATEILVSRVDDNGVGLWQFAYRIGGSTSSSAQAIVEMRDGSGFALTGSVGQATGSHIHALRIRCNGALIWSRVFGNQAAGHRSMGYDVIEAANLAAPAAAGDLVIVGDENVATPAGTVQGRIIRLTPAGALMFDRAYAQPAPQLGLRFRALTESRSAAGGSPDLVVAGSSAFGSNWSTDRRALMFRVRFNGAPVCNASMGLVDSTNEDFHGIVNLTFGNFPQETVLVGASTPPLTGSLPLYMVRFRALGCIPMVQAMWRDPVDNAVAYDVVEIPAGIVGAGSVIAAGTLSSTATPGDAFSLSATPASLGPNAPATRYSTQSPRVETIFSLDLKRDRFVMAGSTFSDWDGIGDGQDFYLVQTTPNRDTQCSVPWNFSWSPVNLPRQQFTPPMAALQQNQAVNVLVLNASDEGYCCTLDPN
jgi:hypothetical protein